MTISEAMIAISAERATLWPKLGPIDSVVGSSARPKESLSSSSTCGTSSGPSSPW